MNKDKHKGAVPQDEQLANDTLWLLAQDEYNYTRPADMILREFGNVLVVLNRKITEHHARRH